MSRRFEMLTLDHVVIYVHDLDDAITDYRNLGFVTEYGGKHASGLTHNALISFADGSYLELLALTDKTRAHEAEFNALLRRDGTEGYTGFALLSTDLSQEYQRLEGAGLEPIPIQHGGRERADGLRLGWQMLVLEQFGMSPFLIQDETERALRVPLTAERTQHPNGVLGIAEITVLVPDLAQAQADYQALLGNPNRVSAAQLSFQLDQTRLTFRLPQNATESAYLTQYGQIPYELGLMSRHAAPLSISHSARLAFQLV